MSDAAADRRKGLLDLIEWVGNKLPDPAFIFVFGAVLVMALSAVGHYAGWAVQPKMLRPAVEVVLDDEGKPVLDAETGQPVTRAVLDEQSRPVLQLVDDLSRNDGQPFRTRNLLSADGLYYAISSMVDNFVNFPPLGVVLVGMLGIGLAERAGFIGAALKAMMVVVPKQLLTPTMIFLGKIGRAHV